MHKHKRNLPLLRAELDREPHNLFNRHHLARVLEGLGEHDEAAAVLEDAVRLARRRRRDPLGVLVFTDLIRLRRARGEPAKGLLNEARRRYPTNKLLWWIDAATRVKDCDYDEALILLDRLVAVDMAMLPADGPAYDERIFAEFAQEARGACLFHLGRYTEAAAAYAQASQSDPSNVGYRAKREAALGRARTAPEGAVSRAGSEDQAVSVPTGGARKLPA